MGIFNIVTGKVIHFNSIYKPINNELYNKIKKLENNKKLSQKIIEYVDKILEITSKENYDPKNLPDEQKELEKKIDKVVYELYGLTGEEIKVIENC